MNPRIKKLKEEKIKNEDRIEKLKARNKYIDQRVESLESTDILCLVRAYHLDPDQLADALGKIMGVPPQPGPDETTTQDRRKSTYEE